jgi:hypothetical protein
MLATIVALVALLSLLPCWEHLIVQYLYLSTPNALARQMFAFSLAHIKPNA